MEVTVLTYLHGGFPAQASSSSSEFNPLAPPPKYNALKLRAMPQPSPEDKNYTVIKSNRSKLSDL